MNKISRFFSFSKTRFSKMWRPGKDALAITMSLHFFLGGNVDLYETHVKNYMHNWVWIPVLLIAVIYAMARTIPKLDFDRELNNGTTIRVRVGNIFDEKCALCFATNDYFETDQLLEPKTSLKSAFISNFFEPDPNPLPDKETNIRMKARKAFDDALKEEPCEQISRSVKVQGQLRRYDSGTLAYLNFNHKQQKVFLVALSHLDLANYNAQADPTSPFYPSYTNPIDLEQALGKLWAETQKKSITELSMPIIGGGLAQSGHDQFMLIQAIIVSFVLRGSKTSVKKLNIIIPEDRAGKSLMLLTHSFLKSLQMDKSLIQ